MRQTPRVPSFGATRFYVWSCEQAASRTETIPNNFMALTIQPGWSEVSSGCRLRVSAIIEGVASTINEGVPVPVPAHS